MTVNSSDEKQPDVSTSMDDMVSQWRNAIPRFANTLITTRGMSGKHHTRICDNLRWLVTASRDRSQLHWKPGHRCPECGSQIVSRWETYTQSGKHLHGKPEVSCPHFDTTVHAWECADCRTILRLSPPAILEPILPAEIPTEVRDKLIQTRLDTYDKIRPDKIPKRVHDKQGEFGGGDSSILLRALNEPTGASDWEVGYPCTFCESSYIYNDRLKKTNIRSENGDWETGASESFHATEYHCGCCDRQLTQTKANVFPNTFFLRL